jgi:hypothetical protein
MKLDPYRQAPTAAAEARDPHASAARVVSLTLMAILVAWVSLGDRISSGSQTILALLVTSVVLLAGLRASQGR